VLAMDGPVMHRVARPFLQSQHFQLFFDLKLCDWSYPLWCDVSEQALGLRKETFSRSGLTLLDGGSDLNFVMLIVERISRKV
jgi:hypothetical protein